MATIPLGENIGFRNSQRETRRKNVNLRNHKWIYLYFVISAALVAMLAGFEGTITLEIPYVLRITMNSHFYNCLIDPPLPKQTQEPESETA